MDDKEQLDQIAKDLLYDLGITFPIKNEMVVARKLVLAKAEIQQLRESLDIAKEKIASLDIDMGDDCASQPRTSRLTTMRTVTFYITDDEKVFMNLTTAQDWENKLNLVDNFLNENIPQHSLELKDHEYVQLPSGFKRTMKQFIVENDVQPDDYNASSH